MAIYLRLYITSGVTHTHCSALRFIHVLFSLYVCNNREVNSPLGRLTVRKILVLRASKKK